jgi:hypothetical protein
MLLLSLALGDGVGDRVGLLTFVLMVLRYPSGVGRVRGLVYVFGRDYGGIAYIDVDARWRRRQQRGDL